MDRRGFFGGVLGLAVLATAKPAHARRGVRASGVNARLPRGFKYDGFDIPGRPAWHAQVSVWHYDDVKVTKAVSDRYCPLGQIHCMAGVAFLNPSDAPPWTRTEIVKIRKNYNLLAWSLEPREPVVVGVNRPCPGRFTKAQAKPVKMMRVADLSDAEYNRLQRTFGGRT